MRRRNPVSSWWIFGIVAGAGAVIAGVAYAASNTPPPPTPTPAPTGGATIPPQATLPTTAPATIALDGSANSTTVQVNAGDKISITLGGSNLPWSFSYSGPAVTQGAETFSPKNITVKPTQMDVFNAVAAGTSVIKAHDSAGGMGQFSVTVVVS